MNNLKRAREQRICGAAQRNLFASTSVAGASGWQTATVAEDGLSRWKQLCPHTARAVEHVQSKCDVSRAVSMNQVLPL